jgi:hypothetical protein
MPGVPTPPGFIPPKPDPTPAPDLPTLKKSLTVKLNDGNERSYPTLADYVDAFVRQGLVEDLPDLIANHSNLLNEIFFNWVATGQLGCLFAARLGKSPREKSRWYPIVQLNALAEGTGLGPFLNVLLDDASDREEAAVVIFPDIEDEDQIVSLVNNLCDDPSGRWYRTNSGIKPDPSGANELIGLRWILKNNTHVNLVLGFATISTMPITRRSPFTAMFLRIREEKLTPLDTEGGRIKVHLADLDSTFPTQAAHDFIIEKTKEFRANLVEPDMNNMAKAKVTFSVSRKAAEALCNPMIVTLEDA